ncbi:MAG: glycine zipper domain-containing protein [Mesorhizobium sp.]
MKKLILGLALLIPLAACTNAEKGAVIGGVGGAALGTAAGGNDTRNALIGGAVGAVAGALVGKAMDNNGNPREGLCRYRDEYGRIYEARCPSGY